MTDSISTGDLQPGGREETLPAIVVFDVGKTNKKVFVFDEHYAIRYEKSVRIEEIKDEDGDACEDIAALTDWVKETFRELTKLEELNIRAVNFSAYGASFVHLGQSGNVVAPLYNYLKPFPAALQQDFYARYGGEESFSLVTASPVLGHLNSGLQLYWLKNKKPDLFSRVSSSLHLPQYLSYLFSGKAFSDITSVGCHTALWNFAENHYHAWIYEEGIADRLAPLSPAGETVNATVEGQPLLCGVGLHDSSAAIIPYLASFRTPFILLSSGTWCISLNPFNHQPLTLRELAADCLCYLAYDGNPVRASRLFAGYEHEQQAWRIASHFGIEDDFYRDIPFNPQVIRNLKNTDTEQAVYFSGDPMRQSGFAQRDLQAFTDAVTAYHRLVLDLVDQQVRALGLVISKPVPNLYVDGGFGTNPVYMNLLAAALPGMNVAAASLAQASAIGAALAIHPSWNRQPMPEHLIELKPYRVTESIAL